jgi:hypothetical protein
VIWPLHVTLMVATIASLYIALASHGWRHGEMLFPSKPAVKRRVAPVYFWCLWGFCTISGLGLGFASVRSLFALVSSGALSLTALLVVILGCAATVLAPIFVVRRLTGNPHWPFDSPRERRLKAAIDAVFTELGDDADAISNGPGFEALMLRDDPAFLEAVAAQLAMQDRPRRLDPAIAGARLDFDGNTKNP